MNLTPTYHEKMSQAEQAIREAQRHAETELAAQLKTLLDQAHADIAGDLTALLDSNDPHEIERGNVLLTCLLHRLVSEAVDAAERLCRMASWNGGGPMNPTAALTMAPRQ